MNELKMISPLLNNIIAGDAISDHNGIRCYPAMNEKTNEKYIIKVISIPSSQTQLDALLLTGALKDEASALQYFEERARELVQELEAIQQLARQEGFLPFVGYQVAAKENAVGFDVYILTQYKRSLERQISKKPLSQLDALNLGLDICSALSACRRNGYLFVNLKPNNIYISDSGEYRIADLGLIPLKSLKYAILPEHYIGDYTAPEIADAFSPLNESVDVYAAGAILFSIYNGGVMPDKINPTAPAYADDELAQILLKAIDPDPANRWENPAQMGQMLVSYMQKNGAFDIPIIPPIPEPEPEIAEPAKETSSDISEMLEIITEIEAEENVEHEVITPAIPSIITANDQMSFSDILDASEIASVEQESGDTDPTAEEEPVIENASEEPVTPDAVSITEEPTLTEPEHSEEELAITEPESTANEPAISIIEPSAEESDAPECETEKDCSQDETIPVVIAPAVPTEPSEDGDVPAEIPVIEGISHEVSEILSQADALAELTVPEPVVVAEPVIPDVPIPQKQADNTDQTNATEENTDMNNEEYFSDEYLSDDQAKPKSHWLRNTIIIVSLLLVLLGGFLFYNFYVLRKVTQFQVVGSGDSITVYVASDGKDDQLSVSFTDPSNVIVSIPVAEGKVTVNNLSPSTKYTISLNISGLHILQNNDPKEYTTPAETTIVNHEVKVGQTAGTVDISFAVNGPESEKWSFTYEAIGVEPNTVEFSGTSFTLKGLKENLIYKGYLTPETNLLIKEPLEIVFSASELIKANDLRIVSCSGGSLVAQWSAPESIKVESWSARCYNENYDETLYDLTKTTATFTGLNSAESFTVEVWAKDQSFRQSIKLDENSITIKDISADLSNPGRITLNWKTSAAPKSGWIVTYRINDSKTTFQKSVTENRAVIDPVAPGAKYTFLIKAADASATTFCDEYNCVVPDVEGTFSLAVGDTAITASSMQISMCRRPYTGAWSAVDVTDSHYTQSFKSGQDAAFLLFLKETFEEADHILNIMVTVEDEDGGIVSVSSQAETWNTMWNQNYYALNVAETPRSAGCYIVTIYINNMYVAEFDMAIS